MDLEFGNAGTVDTRGTGWFVGFSEWTKPAHRGDPELRHVPADSLVRTMTMKWMAHPAGDPRGGTKPVSDGRTLSLLVSEAGEFVLEFCEREDFAAGVVRCVLSRHGDYAAWGAGVFHRYTVAAASTVLTLRWVPVDA